MCGGGAGSADLGGSSANSSVTAKTEEEKGFPTMCISGERAGAEQWRGCRREGEAGGDPAPARGAATQRVC